MIRTIASSFLFLYPVYMSLNYYDYSMMYLCVLALPISVANHSHSWHPDTFRRNLFQCIDISYMLMLTGYAVYPCFISFECTKLVVYQFARMAVLYLYILGGLGTSIEQYNEFQRCVHVWFHYVSIIGLTHIRETCYWEIKNAIDNTAV